MEVAEQNHPARRINALIHRLGATRYIEIGVDTGDTLFRINSKRRVGVDPCFRFDVKKAVDDGTQLFNMTSDDYFSALPIESVFDIYFIDGLHTFEQTLRDFSNAMLHSHGKTVWLIDDTKPNDVFSTLRDWRDAHRFRRMSGSEDLSWHGDVFKLVFYIHDFCPGLNYRTIVGSGNPQTLLWASNNGWRSPLFDNITTISGLTYFDLLNNLSVMRECSEEATLNLCISEVNDA